MADPKPTADLTADELRAEYAAIVAAQEKASAASKAWRKANPPTKAQKAKSAAYQRERNQRIKVRRTAVKAAYTALLEKEKAEKAEKK